jgi:hypothetical protein
MQCPPALDRVGKRVRHIGQRREPGAGILAALGVVGGGGEQAFAGQSLQPLPVVAMEGLDGREGAAGLAADLVQRQQRHPAVERGVLERLRHQRAGQLLQPDGEIGPPVSAFIRRRTKATASALSCPRRLAAVAHTASMRAMSSALAPRAVTYVR